MPTILKPDPFSVTLLESEPLVVSSEQQMYILKILETSCSDSRFAEKAYFAIMRVLTVGPTEPPVIGSLSPDSAVLGSPSFTLHVNGTGFSPTSVIVFNGGEEPTTFVSETELTTEVDMTTVTVASTVPVAVSDNGIISEAQTFTFTDIALQMTSARKSEKFEKEAEPVHAIRRSSR